MLLYCRDRSLQELLPQRLRCYSAGDIPQILISRWISDMSEDETTLTLKIIVDV